MPMVANRLRMSQLALVIALALTFALALTCGLSHVGSAAGHAMVSAGALTGDLAPHAYCVATMSGC